MSKKILILGANGFIGSNLTEQILREKDWHVSGFDVSDHKLEECLGHQNFDFKKGDLFDHEQWIEEKVKEADVVLPLIAIANPALYVSDPLLVFKLDFESNLQVIKWCVQYKKRIIFPSTSEVYGMSPDTPFDEEKSNLVLGPIHKQRWIYSCAKQMLDRVIYAYGIHEKLDYTLFRPFNWLGPKMDDVFAKKENSSRAIIQFINNILYQRPIKLMDGGKQKRCFTFIGDGVSALVKMIENENGAASGRIFNIGNPNNNLSIADAAQEVISVMKEYEKYAHFAEKAKVETVASATHFGAAYEDVKERIPSIENAKKYLDWTPTKTFREIIKNTLDYHLIQNPGTIESD